MAELSPLEIDRTAHSHSPSVPLEGTNLPTFPLGRVDRRNYKISTTTKRGINELKITPQNDKEKEAFRRLGYANKTNPRAYARGFMRVQVKLVQNLYQDFGINLPPSGLRPEVSSKVL